MFYCKCGHKFSLKRHLVEHIGICNPHWPRVSDKDEHKQVSEQEWHDKRIAKHG